MDAPKHARTGPAIIKTGLLVLSERWPKRGCPIMLIRPAMELRSPAWVSEIPSLSTIPGINVGKKDRCMSFIKCPRQSRNICSFDLFILVCNMDIGVHFLSWFF
jgi:hypothetical protein